jgi:hypothetical protein
VVVGRALGGAHGWRRALAARREGTGHGALGGVPGGFWRRRRVRVGEREGRGWERGRVGPRGGGGGLGPEGVAAAGLGQQGEARPLHGP